MAGSWTLPSSVNGESLFLERVDLILAWGLNTIGENQITKEIVEGMQELKSTIDAHSESHGHEAPCVLSVYILSYVPMFCSLDIPLGDRYSEWVPPPNFNLSCTRRVSELLPKNTEILHKHFPEKPICREPEVRKRLHLTLPFKVNVRLKKTAKCLQHLLRNIGDWVNPAKLRVRVSVTVKV